jgi:hypothetical protein
VALEAFTRCATTHHDQLAQAGSVSADHFDGDRSDDDANRAWLRSNINGLRCLAMKAVKADSDETSGTCADGFARNRLFSAAPRL